MTRLGTLALMLCALATILGGAASADVVTDWNQTALRATEVAGFPPPPQTRAMAMVHAAIEQPTHFELVINLKTAAALGLTIPRVVLLRATATVR